jgi:hypothetical protein
MMMMPTHIACGKSVCCRSIGRHANIKSLPTCLLWSRWSEKRIFFCVWNMTSSLLEKKIVSPGMFTDEYLSECQNFDIIPGNVKIDLILNWVCIGDISLFLRDSVLKKLMLWKSSICDPQFTFLYWNYSIEIATHLFDFLKDHESDSAPCCT